MLFVTSTTFLFEKNISLNKITILKVFDCLLQIFKNENLKEKKLKTSNEKL
jgi:hypothetical protein